MLEIDVNLATSLAEAGTLADLGECFLPTLARSLGASHTLLFEFDDAGGLIPHAGSMMSLMPEYGSGPVEDDPVHGTLATLSPRPIADLDRVSFDWDGFRRTAAYNEFYARYDIEHLTALWPFDIPYGRPGMVGLLTTRSHRSGMVAAPGRELLAALRRPLRSAIQRCRREDALKRHARLLEQTLDHTGAACAVFDRHGRVLWSSGDATGLLANPGLRSRLTGEVRALEARSEHAVDAAVDIRVVDEHDAAWGVAFERMQSDGRESRWIAKMVPDLGRERLTAAERRTLTALASGQPNAEIARASGVSVETVRTHVKRIFAKLGVSNRSQAAVVAHKLGLI